MTPCMPNSGKFKWKVFFSYFISQYVNKEVRALTEHSGSQSFMGKAVSWRVCYK